MEALFLKLVNMSITASWIVLAVVILRVLFKKAPKAFRVLMWGLVGIRLIFPFSFESVLSLIPSTETLPSTVISGPSFDIKSGIGVIDNSVNEYLDDRYFEGVTVPADNGYNTMHILSVMWIIGIIVMVLYSAVSYIKIAKSVRESINLRENIFICDRIPAPFVLGVIRPRIFIPSSMDEADRKYVIAHEKAHIERRDHLWKPLGFLLLAGYWFNPLIWAAYILLCRDIELACDERVIKAMGNDSKKEYSSALINCSVRQRYITACPLAFGETGVKGRIKSVLGYKKPAFWIIGAAAVVCIFFAVCFLTNPVSSVSAVINQKGYQLIRQTEKSIDITIQKSRLPAEAFTEDGIRFTKGEITVYENTLSEMYLEEASVDEIDGEKWLNLAFNFDYDIVAEGILTLPHKLEFDGHGITNYTLTPVMLDETVRDAVTSYPKAAFLRGTGPDQKLFVCVRLDVYDSALGEIGFTLDGFQDTEYAKKSIFKKETYLSENYGIVAVVCAAECDNVVFRYESGTINEEFPHINVRWENVTGDKLCFGDDFTLYKGDEVCEMKEGYGFDSIRNVVENNQSLEECLVLSGFYLEDKGEYRLEKQFWLESAPHIKYTAYINFKIDLRYSFLGKQYEGDKVIGESVIMSFHHTAESIPTFYISDEDFSLSTSDYPEPSISSSFYWIDGLQKIKLEKENFDELMMTIDFEDGYSAKKLRKNNLNAFSAFDTAGRIYYLLEQKNGDIYIAQGYYGEATNIYWIFKMKERTNN